MERSCARRDHREAWTHFCHLETDLKQDMLISVLNSNQIYCKIQHSMMYLNELWSEENRIPFNAKYNQWISLSDDISSASIKTGTYQMSACLFSQSSPKIRPVPKHVSTRLCAFIL